MVITTAAYNLMGGTWQIASDLPGRLRIRSRELTESALLRQHCQLVLNSCHWLVGFRINGLAGSLCLAYPHHRRREVQNLLQQALTLTAVDNSFDHLPPARFSGQRFKRTLFHGMTCAALLSLEGAIAIPTLAMAGLTAVLLLPLARKVLHELKHRQVTVEALELGFSGVLITQGLTAEALLDLAISDAVELTQSAVEREDLDLDADHLLRRLAEGGKLHQLEADGSSHERLLKDIDLGQTIRIDPKEHCLLSARLLKGDLLIVNRLVDGDWRPRRVQAGDLVEPGALVISGQAEAKIEHCMHTDPVYTLLREQSRSSAPELSGAELWVHRYKRVVPPVLLGLGGTLLSLGSIEAALASFQFNPLNDWQEQKLAAQLTTIANLKLHNLHIRNAVAIEALGKIRHLVISRSCLDRIGGIQVRERPNAAAGTPTGSLVQLLAGIQNWICGVDGTAIWSRQLQNVANPVAVSHVDIRTLREGWAITAVDGRRWLLQQQPLAHGAKVHTHLTPLQIWQQDTLLGTVELHSEPDEHWVDTCRALRELGIEIHLIASEEVDRLDEVAGLLGIDHRHRHGSCTALERLELVRHLQDNGDSVGFVGYVLHDLAALAQADVSIGMDVDDDSRYLSNICDLSLGSNPLWMPRLISISRRLQQASGQNFGLLGTSQLIASLATAAGWIAPLQTVLLSDIPLLLAELNNLAALNAPKSLSPIGTWLLRSDAPLRASAPHEPGLELTTTGEG